MAAQVTLRGGSAMVVEGPTTGPLTLASLVSHWAVNTPDAPAIDFGGGVWTYRDLDVRAAHIADHLDTLSGDGTGEGVWALALPRHRMIEALVAVSRVGGAALPLDPAYPIERLAYMLEDSRPRALVTSTSLIDRFLDARLPVLTIESIDRAVGSDPVPATHARPGARTRGAAFIIYTSGSTGKPKGVVLENAGLAGFTRSAVEAARVSNQSRIAAVASPSFDGAILELLIAFGVGAALVVPVEPVLGGTLLSEFLSDARVSHVFGPPSSLMRLEPASVPLLDAILAGGEALPAALAARWADHAAVINVYGPTETTIAVTLNRLEGLQRPDEVPSLGRPVSEMDVLVLSADLDEVAPNEVGEIYIAGPGLGRGYLNRPPLTSERFIACPFRTGQRMYRTGDLARRRLDGDIDFIGRVDDQVKLRGFRIELNEVKSVLETNPRVETAAVLVREDRPGDQTLVAYVVVDDPAVVAGLRTWLAARLPTFMLPDHFVRIESLPLSPNGKLDRASLPRPVSSPPVRPPFRPTTMTHTQAIVHAIWCAVLDRGSVDLDDNFFDVGGNSMRLVQVRNELNSRHGAALSAVQLFERTTVRKLAEALDELGLGVGDGVLGPVDTSRRVPSHAPSAMAPRQQ